MIVDSFQYLGHTASLAEQSRQRPEPSHALQFTTRFRLSHPRSTLRLPDPSHLAQRRDPLQKEQALAAEFSGRAAMIVRFVSIDSW